jgi:hypothetical protein
MLNAWAREGDDIIHLYSNLIHQLEMEGSLLTQEKKTPILRRMHQLEELLIRSPVLTSGHIRRDGFGMVCFNMLQTLITVACGMWHFGLGNEAKKHHMCVYMRHMG